MQASARIHVILARDAPVAAVLRRGPSKQVLLSAWNLARDTLEHGQWFKGRIYEQRCDLSPNGEYLVYFAASQRPPFGSWTAVSRPPYLTALLLYPKGDCWGGGGSFASDRRLDLNHRVPGETRLAEGYRLPRRLEVGAFGDYPGRGEDDPIRHQRMIRDGWVLQQAGTGIQRGFDASPWVVYDPPCIYARPHRVLPALSLERRTVGLNEKNGPWEIKEHRVTGPGEAVLLDLGRSDWADWDFRGDLLFARDGRLHRCRGPRTTAARPEIGPPVVVADLRGLTFRQLAPPTWATEWKGRRRS